MYIVKVFEGGSCLLGMRITRWILKAASSSMACNKQAVVAVCQVTATNNKEKNLEICRELAFKARGANAQMAFFPEACDYIGTSKEETLSLSESLGGPTIQAYQKLAQETGLWLSFGGVHEKVNDGKVHNTHVVISSEGKIEGVYRKLHLFDVDYPEGRVFLKESSYCQAGTKIVPPVKTPIGNVGLSICYDMRFAELSQCLRSLGAHILTYPSAFTFATGSAHWETILKARAIETQCYVIAAAQTGAHNPKRTSWGHAMIVDPWGSVVAQCSEGVNLAVATVDLSYLDKVRKSMPVGQHRRSDIYSLAILAASKDDVQPAASYEFGQVTVPEGAVFYKTSQTIAFTNKKCVVPGHVLVAPIRRTERFGELNGGEVADLFVVVHKIQGILEKLYDGSSTSVVIQDGPDAGQTIKHVHVHILPRRKGDFPENDDIYKVLQKHDKQDGGWRTEDDMVKEADTLRKHFANL